MYEIPIEKIDKDYLHHLKVNERIQYEYYVEEEAGGAWFITLEVSEMNKLVILDQCK